MRQSGNNPVAPKLALGTRLEFCVLPYQGHLTEQHCACLLEGTAASSDPLDSQTSNSIAPAHPSHSVWWKRFQLQHTVHKTAANQNFDLHTQTKDHCGTGERRGKE